MKSEFNLFKKVTEEVQLKQFYTEWNGYLGHLTQTARTKKSISAGSLDETPNNNVAFGKHIAADVELSEEQTTQLQKLKEETSKTGGQQ